MFDIKAGDKGKRTHSPGRTETLAIQQLGDNNENKDKGIQSGRERLLINHISNYLSLLAAKPTPLQQLQNATKILLQYALMSCFFRLLIFNLLNSV